MPEHVHLLLSEPEVRNLDSTLRVLKGETSKRLKGERDQFWQRRYYDWNVGVPSDRSLSLGVRIQSPEAWSPDPKTGFGAASATTQQEKEEESRSSHPGPHKGAKHRPTHRDKTTMNGAPYPNLPKYGGQFTRGLIAGEWAVTREFDPLPPKPDATLRTPSASSDLSKKTTFTSSPSAATDGSAPA